MNILNTRTNKELRRGNVVFFESNSKGMTFDGIKHIPKGKYTINNFSVGLVSFKELIYWFPVDVLSYTTNCLIRNDIELLKHTVK